MIKRIWKAIVGVGYSTIIGLIDSLDQYKPEISKLIASIPANKIADVVVDFVKERLTELAKKVFGRK